jgi:hypothetical protein
MTIFDQPLSCAEKEFVHLPAQFFIPEENERKEEEDKTDEQPKCPVWQTFSSGRIRRLLGQGACNKIYHNC